MPAALPPGWKSAHQERTSTQCPVAAIAARRNPCAVAATIGSTGTWPVLASPPNAEFGRKNAVEYLLGDVARTVKKDDVIKEILPQFFPKHWLDEIGIVFADFPSRIRIGYVHRVDGGYSYLMDQELPRLELSVPELQDIALTNLARLPSASITIGKVPEGPEGWISATDDNFAAVRILLPSVQQLFRKSLGEEFHLVIPHRDSCFCWSRTQPEERQSKHAEEALEDFLQDDYKLTPDILLCSRHGFTLHREQVVA